VRLGVALAEAFCLNIDDAAVMNQAIDRSYGHESMGSIDGVRLD